MKALLPIIALLVVCSCTTTKYVPVNQIRNVTTVVRDTVVEVITQSERVEVVVPKDTTSVLFTKYATSTVKVQDGMLRHTLWQPLRVDSVRMQYITHHVTDSIPYPVEVEVIKEKPPKWAWWMLAYTGITIFVFALFVLKRIKIV